MCSIFLKPFIISAPNNYTLTPMLGTTKESGKPQAPIFSMSGRQKQGGFHEDLAKVRGSSHWPPFY